MLQNALMAVLLPVLVQVVVQLTVLPAPAVLGVQTVVLLMTVTARKAKRLPMEPVGGTVTIVVCTAVLPTTPVFRLPGLPASPVVPCCV